MTQANRAIHGQPDQQWPDHPCPNCGYRPAENEEAAACRLLKKNAGRVHKTIIATALNRSVGWVERFARRHGFDLDLPREHDPRGA